jgi:UDP-glucuronate decarboxylase
MSSEHDYSTFHVLLTGGTGFFGRALLRNWISQSQSGEKIAPVCVLSRNPQSFLKNYPEFSEQSWLHFHQGNILNPNTLPRDEFSHVLHAATDSTIGPQLTPLDRYIQIVDGTRNMLEYAVEKNVQRFLLTSSGGVYGPQPQEMTSIKEDYNGMPDPLKAENAYSVAKRCAEHLCSLYRVNFGLHTVVARCFSFVGRDLPLDAHFAIGNFIHDALNRNEIQVKGDGRAVRTYLDQRDLAIWLCALLYRGADGEAYNVGSDIPITILELANLVRETLAPQVGINFSCQASISNFRVRYVPNINKALTKLNLKIKYPLSQAIVEATHRSF